MTMYGFDADRGEIVAVWPVGVGSRAGRVATVDDGAAGAVLAHALTGLSQVLWDMYVYPASAADDEQERWARDQEREDVHEVMAALRQPRLPDEAAEMEVSGSPVAEAAHRVGRAMRQAAGRGLTQAVLDEVATEIDAMRRAELGDLSGRAMQATALDRVDVSPVQVAAADAILARDPLGEDLLTAGVDPAAACVAAAHWLAAAAEVAAAVSGAAPMMVFAEADNIEAVSVEVPGLVVAAVVDGGQTAREVVTYLLKVAVAAGRGEIADLEGVAVVAQELEDLFEHLPEDERAAARMAEPIRTTPLDPRRPARDLLEHLLNGIASCYLVFGQHTGAGLADADPAPADRLVFAEQVRSRAAFSGSRPA